MTHTRKVPDRELFEWELASDFGLKLPMIMDGFNKDWFFSKAHALHLAERKEWNGGSHEQIKQGIYFTSGSKNEHGVNE